MAAPNTTAPAVPQQIPPEGSETPAPKKPRRMRARGQRGSIYKRGKSWCIIYRTNERKQKVETHPSKEAAQARLTEVIKAIREHRFIDAKPELFSTFTAEWLKRRQSTLKPGVWRSYKSALDKWLTPEFGEFQMREITRPMVKAFASKLLDSDLKGKSVQNFLRLLHSIFEEAIDAEVSASNPAHKLKINFPDDGKERVVPSKADLLGTLGELGETPVYQALLASAALTGCRRGELCGLLWREVDWPARTIHIERSLVRIHQSKAGSHKNLEWICSAAFACAAPKSKKGRREIAMPPQLEKLLRQLRAISNEKNPFVFQGAHGPLDMDQIADLLHAAQDRAKVKRFGLHGVRHFFASAMHEAGATLAQAKEHLGHATIDMTAKYTHVLESGREHVEAVGRDFSSVAGLLAQGSSHEKRKEAAL
jgi:integrase